jgi:hypothetical protein
MIASFHVSTGGGIPFMGITYALVCIDCCLSLDLGKMYSVEQDGTSHDETRLQGVYDTQSGSFHARDQLFGRVIEGFLIRHRNHLLRFSWSQIDELYDGLGADIKALDIADVLSPSPDETDSIEEEIAAWKVILTKR